MFENNISDLNIESNTDNTKLDDLYEAQRYICDDMKNTWAVLWRWLEAITRKAYLLLATATAIIAMFLSLQPRETYPLMLIPPVCVILGALPCAIPALLAIKGKWNGLKWSEHSELSYDEVLEQSGQMMEDNINELWNRYENSRSWLQRGRKLLVGGIATGTLSYITIAVIQSR